MSTVTAVSNWSFRTFRSRLSQQGYSHQPPSFQPSQPPMHAPPLGYFREQEQHDNVGKEDGPLLLEQPQTDFVTGRSRSREERLRTPSPVKRGRQFS